MSNISITPESCVLIKKIKDALYTWQKTAELLILFLAGMFVSGGIYTSVRTSLKIYNAQRIDSSKQPLIFIAFNKFGNVRDDSSTTKTGMPLRREQHASSLQQQDVPAFTRWKLHTSLWAWIWDASCMSPNSFIWWPVHTQQLRSFVYVVKHQSYGRNLLPVRFLRFSSVE